MKHIKLIVFAALFSVVGLHETKAQSSIANDKAVEQKISLEKTPKKVKEVLKNYSKYTISQEATVQKKNGSKKVYTFKMVKGNWTQFLLIDQSGKVIGIRSDEG